MMPKLQLMVTRKQNKFNCIEKLDCHERHNCRVIRQKVVSPSKFLKRTN